MNEWTNKQLLYLSRAIISHSIALFLVLIFRVSATPPLFVLTQLDLVSAIQWFVPFPFLTVSAIQLLSMVLLVAACSPVCSPRLQVCVWCAFTSDYFMGFPFNPCLIFFWLSFLLWFPDLFSSSITVMSAMCLPPTNWISLQGNLRSLLLLLT